MRADLTMDPVRPNVLSLIVAGYPLLKLTKHGVLKLERSVLMWLPGSPEIDKPAWEFRLSNLPPMIDKFTADLCGESFRSETDLYAFARRRKIKAPILYSYSRAMIGHRRRFIRYS